MNALQHKSDKSLLFSTRDSIFKHTLPSSSSILRFATCGTAVLCLFLASFAAAQSYTITGLGALSDPGNGSGGTGINDGGEVVGGAAVLTDGGYHAFLWTKEHGIRDLGALPPSKENWSTASAINSSGVIAGYSTDKTRLSPSHAVLWIDGKIHNLGGNNAEAFAINDLGEVVGVFGQPLYSGSVAFLWTPKKGFEKLGTLPGGNASEGNAINRGGEIVGDSNAKDGNTHAFVWTTSHGMRALPYLNATDNFASASAINRQGLIVGTSGTFPTNLPFTFTTGVLWDGDSQVVEIAPSNPSGIAIYPSAINDCGEVVGTVGYGVDIPSAAFLWTRKGGWQWLQDLIPNNPGWVSLGASGINNRGQITGGGINPDGNSEGFLLTPVEEEPECK